MLLYGSNDIVGSSASLPSSRVPPLQTAAPYSVCCAGDSTSYERFSQTHHMTELIPGRRSQRWQRLFQNMRVQLFPAFGPSVIDWQHHAHSIDDLFYKANVQHTGTTTSRVGKRGHLPSR